MTTKYKVQFYMDNTYEVIEIATGCFIDDKPTYKSVFQGSLSDCEAFIRLKEGGYM